MSNIQQFFNKNNTIQHISDDDTKQLQHYLAVAEAFSRISYKSIYVIDYQTQSFEYVSDNPLFLCGLSSQEVKDLGYEFYFKNVKKEDLDLLLKINEIGFDFYEKLPIDERKDYSISYDFHLINEQGNPILVNHKLTPIYLNKEGKIWKAMCLVSLSNQPKAGNICISKQGSNEIWKYNLTTDIWEKEQKIQLKKRETEILKWASRGLSISEMATKLFLSPDTIKFHRRKIFEKIGVQNISEALAYAKMNKVI